MWDDNQDREIRFQAFCQQIEELEPIPDIICLQEVNKFILHKLLQLPWAQNYFSSYSSLTVENDKNRDKVELVLSKFPIVISEAFPFTKTSTQQFIHIVDIQIPLNYFSNQFNINSGQPQYTRTFTVITTQLEKLNAFSEMRKQQLYNLLNTLIRRDTAFILADTQITDEEDDAISLPEPWIDVFEEQFIQLEKQETNPHTDTEEVVDKSEELQKKYMESFGLTYFSDKNKYVTGFQQYRFDRILYKSPNWKCSHFNLIFIDPPVSSHFGLHAIFEIN